MSYATTLEPARPSTSRHRPRSVVMQWTFTLLMDGLFRSVIRTLEATGRAERFLSSMSVQNRKRANEDPFVRYTPGPQEAQRHRPNVLVLSFKAMKDLRGAGSMIRKGTQGGSSQLLTPAVTTSR